MYFAQCGETAITCHVRHIAVQSDPDDLAVVVPLNAIFTEDESDWVYVNIGDYHYQKRPVKVGLRLKDRAVILEGLKPGERLVVQWRPAVAHRAGYTSSKAEKDAL